MPSLSQKSLDDALGRVTIPELQYASSLGLPGEDLSLGADDLSVVLPDQLISALRHRNRSLSVFAKCQTRHAKRRCFFLYASGVGEDKRSPVKQTEKVPKRQKSVG